MAQIGDSIHLRELEEFRRGTWADEVYGYQWGDPRTCPRLQGFIVNYILPHARSYLTALEIGCGGGRMTQYLLGFAKVYAMDYYQEMFEEMNRYMPDTPTVDQVLSAGTDFAGVGLVHYVLAFDTFTYFDLNVIEGYLDRLRPYLHEDASVVFNFSSSSQGSPVATDTTPEAVRALLERLGYAIVEYDGERLPHTPIIRCQLQLDRED